MNWEAIGAIGQMMGSIAVFITLTYLAIQVRHARTEIRRSVSQSRHEASREVNAGFRDSRVLGLYAKAAVVEGVPQGAFHAYAMEHWGMTYEETVLLINQFLTSWQSRLQVIPYVDELSDIERHDFVSGIRVLYGSPGPMRKFYELFIRTSQHPDVVRYIDNVLAQPR
jgi:hypothetical protein